MKKFIFLTILLIMFDPGTAKAQNWAPDGAEWYYEYVHFWYMGYIQIDVVGDTVIHDTTCRILEKRSVIRNLEFDTTYYRYIGQEYMFSDDDRVYVYANNRFYILYDFTSLPGDTLIIPQNDDLLEWCDTIGRIVVTDTGSIELNGQLLRKLIVQPLEGTHWAIYGEIIEKIGPVDSYMLPEPDWACVVDLYEGGRLRCYSDPDFGLYSTGISTECDYLVSVPEEEETIFTIYPNPCSEVLNVLLPDDKLIYTLSIYSPDGKKVMERSLKTDQNQIEVSHIKPGLYILIITDNRNTFYRKVVFR